MSLLRIRCPHPEECGQVRHWDPREWVGCVDLDDAASVRRYEQEEEAREAQEWEQVFAQAGEQHRPLEPPGVAERLLRDHGERQLRHLDPAVLLVLGLLTGSGVVRVNEALRSGHGLDAACAADLDWAGYSSNGDFAAAAAAAFTALGPVLELPSPVTVYRGLSVRPGSSLAGSLPPGGVFQDPGFAFAAATAEEAAYYTTDEAWWVAAARDPSARSVVLELEVSRGVCIPHPEHRSRALVAHLARTRQVGADRLGRPEHQHPTALERAFGQVIVPSGSRWQVVDQPAPGRVRLRQM